MGDLEDSALVGPVKRFGRYTLVKKLATGGMAEIWLARQSGLAGFNRFVVVKKILSHLSEQKTFVDMFLDEARTSAQLNHPNVVQIYDLGREGDAYFIAMEYIAGENLAAIAWRGMKRHRPVPCTFAARIIADASKALHYAHHLRGSDGRPLEIVHRDISPQNVLVTYDGEIKVVDFGIAKAATKSEQTKTGMLKGKFSYMSPEQCLGAPVDMRSDVFALGILLYELCTGKRLFKHESELMILEMITKRTVVSPSQVADGISPTLDAIIMKALRKDVDQRFQTAQELQHALEAFLREEAETASSVQVGEYVRALFPDKIAEKRRLIEIASRDDFEERFAVQESDTSMTGPRRTVHGLPPSQVMVRGLPSAPGTSPQYPSGAYGSMQGYGHPGMSQTASGFIPPPGATPSAAYAQGSQGQYSAYGTGALTGVQPAAHAWGTRLVIGLALLVIAGASIVLYSHRQPVETAPKFQTTGAQPASLETGSLSLESKPSGAAISLDGNPMRLADGSQARTPADLSPLQYGQTYKIGLSLANHQGFEQELVMGKQWDGKTLRPDLIPMKATLIARVVGGDPQAVQLWFGNQEVGPGPQQRRTFPGDAGVVAVEGRREGWACRSEPRQVRIQPNQVHQVEVSCFKPRPRPRSVAEAPPPRTPAPSRPSPRTGCMPDPNLPKGFLTIDTNPPSQIFYQGRRLGETPLPKYPLPAGCLELLAKTDGATKKFKVRLEPNKVAVYRVDLAP